ncbi:MAG: hypothetical protein ABJA82_12960 [Myxococcales bacterium]
MATVVLLLGRGCYNPKVTPGGLHCAPASSGKQCPDGFSCIAALCEPTGGSAATGGRGGASGSGGAGGGCANPIAPSCQTPAGAPPGCDHVCQTGCGCGLRCSVAGTVTACVPVAGQKSQGDICSPASDECAPGLVCLKESCGTNLGRCYRFCRENSDCGGVCGTPIMLPSGDFSGFKVCNVGDQVPACDVYAKTGCPDPNLVCFVASPNTKCDCPSGANRTETQKCSLYNDCAPGLLCLATAGSPAPQCHRLCRTSADCSGGAACSISGSSGYCP